MTLVSVIIPAYNRAKVIERSVQSVLAQTSQEFELLVVDDGSTDNTAGVISALAAKDRRVHFMQHEMNRGAQAARNTGIRAARGEWIAFLDSDDEWLPHSLESRLAAAREEFKVVHSDCYVVRADGEMKRFGVPPLAGPTYRTLLTQPGPVFPALLVAKEALERIGYLDEKIVSWQEWDTSIRLARYYPFGFVAEPTFIYDCRGTDTISRSTLRDAVGYEQIVCKHALAMLLHIGPRTLAKHYRTVADRYQMAEDRQAARRCIWLARLWWPFHLKALMCRLSQVLSTGTR